MEGELNSQEPGACRTQVPVSKGAGTERSLESKRDYPQQLKHRQQQQHHHQQEREYANAEQNQLEEKDSHSHTNTTKNLTPEEYLQHTGVSSAIEKALGLVATLRPFDPLHLFATIIRDQVRNTHPAARQAKLLTHARLSMTEAHPCRSLYHDDYYNLPSRTDSKGLVHLSDTDRTSPYRKKTAGKHAGKKGSLNPNTLEETAYQLENVYEPLYRFLCENGSCGGYSGKDRGDCGAGAGNVPGRKGVGRARRGRYLEGNEVERSGGPAGVMAGCRASWREVRRFLEALCREARVDEECIAAAMAALEREGFEADSRGTRAAGGWSREIEIDFSRFVSAVRAVLLFEGFNREARKAILELTGKVDGPAPLHDLLARLFPHRDCPPNNERENVRETIQERLDLGLLPGETKVHLSTITDCVFRPPTNNGRFV